jgi:hypothetical protein
MYCKNHVDVRVLFVARCVRFVPDVIRSRASLFPFAVEWVMLESFALTCLSALNLLLLVMNFMSL